MAFSGTSNYLKLRYIKPGDSNWFGDATYNLRVLDTLGMNFFPQNSPGAVTSWRAVFADGSIADAIRIIPNTDGHLDIYLGRSGYSDRVIFSGLTSVFSVLGLTNTAPGVYSQYTLYVTAKYLAEQNASLVFDVQNNAETTMVIPADFANAKPWLGSSMQLELEGGDSPQRQAFLQFQLKDPDGIPRTFVIPAYII